MSKPCSSSSVSVPGTTSASCPASAAGRRDAGRRRHGRADPGWLRLSQARHALGRGRAPVVRRAGQGRQLPGQRGRLLCQCARAIRWSIAACSCPRTGSPRPIAPGGKHVGVPDDLAFRTRTALAWEMARAAAGAPGLALPLGDRATKRFGKDPALLDAIAAAGAVLSGGSPARHAGLAARPPTAVPPRPGTRVRPFTPERLAPDAPAPVRVDALAAARARVRSGSGIRSRRAPKGRWWRSLPSARGRGARGLPGPAVWLVLRRSLEETPELKTYLSNAPADHAAGDAGRRAGMRWPVESAIEESKERGGAGPLRGARLGRLAPPHDDELAGASLSGPAALPVGGKNQRR